MSPFDRRRSRYDRFGGDQPLFAARLAVDAGVKVAKPGTVTSLAARDLLTLALQQFDKGPLTRGRTYARAGQIVELRIVDDAPPAGRTVAASIQGSDPQPYQVSLTRLAPPGQPPSVEATCTCPYGCRPLDWCKHVAALVYVVADLVDRDDEFAGALLGQGEDDAAGGASSSSGALDGDATGAAAGTGAGASSGLAREDLVALVATLRATAPRPVPADVWQAAFATLPPPGQAR